MSYTLLIRRRILLYGVHGLCVSIVERIFEQFLAPAVFVPLPVIRDAIPSGSGLWSDSNRQGETAQHASQGLLVLKGNVHNLFLSFQERCKNCKSYFILYLVHIVTPGSLPERGHHARHP